ncbi:elongation factor 1 alpha-like protein [Pseudohyphozyma bogoriensis]|nr:elongation factor 1 alpha-like protein [Pseudohyphozyma bogoriensis]
MSRHRAIGKLSLDDELDDGAFSSEGEEDMEMDDIQQAQMASGVMAVRERLGPSSPISDREIRSALWNFYFDVDESLAYVKEEQKKKDRAAAAKMKKTPSQTPSARTSRPTTPAPGTSTPKPKPTPKTPSTKPPVAGPVSQLRSDLEGLNLVPSSSGGERASSQTRSDAGSDDIDSSPPTPVISIAKEKILEEVRKKEAEEKPVLSLVVVGHVDAGKSTLMGRVLHELGILSDRALQTNQRQAQKIGKASFAYAWTFDATEEERERGVTIDVAIDGFETSTKRFTLIDAPGHRDFIPNMISGAAQADTAVLVIDGSTGGFERGFEGGGQTREHAVLVRSLGVQQLVVAVNKLDMVGWAQSRFEGIREALTPFLSQSGFAPTKVFFVPVGATSGENLVERTNANLKSWYIGPTLVEQLDVLEVPPRALDSPLRIPVSNVFRGQSATASGLAISGRIESGIIQVGEQLAALPGDGTGVVRSLEVDGVLVPWAVAGVNATVYLSGLDPRNLSVGTVLCPVSQMVPVASSFLAQIVVFDPGYPITAGASVELFHHSRDIPATIVALEATLDKTTGAVLRKNPRMLTKGASARVRIQLRPMNSSTTKTEIPIEPFSVNKSMGRVLFRRGGETIAAGIVLSLEQ